VTCPGGQDIDSSDAESLKIAIAGAGRMGQAIAAAAAIQGRTELVGVWSRDPDRDRDGFAVGTELSPDLAGLAAAADVLIDFSLPAGTEAAAEAAAGSGTPLVSGVSGLDQAQVARLRSAAGTVAIVYDRNMSQGIAVLSVLAEQAAASLGLEFRLVIDETHHVHKIDAPSGTALKLGEAVAGARGRSLEDVMWYEEKGAPPADAVQFHVERRDEVPGDHSVRFESPAESLVLSHSVADRNVFAAGALRAARWVSGQAPGLYSMRDVLCLTKQKK
jgi:4-hydroxy-tetrahydrodipicolinate reductase